MNPAIYHLSFNQDYTRFAAACDNGVQIFNTNPFTHLFPLKLDSHGGGGIGLVGMLLSSDSYCLVGGGPNPNFPYKLMLWHISRFDSRLLGERTFRSKVKNVKLRHNAIVVVSLQKIFVINPSNFRVLDEFETDLNTKGLCEISNTYAPFVLACLGRRKGLVIVKKYEKLHKFEKPKTEEFRAHDSEIACMAMTRDGRILATASTKGTLIRVFSTLDRSLLQEVRRGSEIAEIYSLAFSSEAKWLAVSSDKGTVHVFCLKIDSVLLENDTSESDGASQPNHANSLRVSPLSMLKGILPKYFSSERSVAKFLVPERLKHFVGFGSQNNTIVIIGMDGSFYRCEFDPVSGGNMIQLEHRNFLNVVHNEVLHV